MNILKLLALSGFLMATPFGATAQTPPPDPTAKKVTPPAPQPKAVADPASVPAAEPPLGVRRVAPTPPGQKTAGKERKRYQIRHPRLEPPVKKALRSSTKRGVVEETRAAVGKETDVVALLKKTHAKDDIRIVQEVSLLNLAAAELTDEQAAQLRADGFEVVDDPVYILQPPVVDPSDRPIRSAPTRVMSTPAGTILLQKQISRVRADEAWRSGLRGKGVVVAVVDSGVRGDHELFQSNGGRILQGLDVSFSGNGWNDDYGHGTHVAGIIVGADGIGVAPEAQVLPIKVFHLNRVTNLFEASEEDILRAFQEAIIRGVDVINFSGGQPARTSNQGDWDTMLQTAKHHEILVVVAAGNIHPDFPWETQVASPGASPDALTVGALTDDDRMASFTLLGGAFWHGQPQRKADLATPGIDVLSAYPLDELKRPSLTQRKLMHGTSMATPIVAGMGALVVEALKSKGTAVTEKAVRDALTSSATRPGSLGAGDPAGFGVPDTVKALQAVGFVSKPTDPPVVVDSETLKRLKERIQYWREQGFDPPPQ